MNNLLDRTWQAAGMACFEVLLQHLHRGTAERNEKLSG
jgi:hypothetical protein